MQNQNNYYGGNMQNQNNYYGGNNVQQLLTNTLPPLRGRGISEAMPGYRFRPTPQTLILDYLKPKIQNILKPDYQLLMPDLDVYSQSPMDLVHGREGLDPMEEEWYFMTQRKRKYRNGGRPDRKAGDGYWRISGKEKPVFHNGQQIGVHTVLDYLTGTHPTGKKTSWKMHEYVVMEGDKKAKVETWAICKIYRLERESKDNDEAEPEPQTLAADNAMGMGQHTSGVPAEVSDHAENVQTNQFPIQGFAGSSIVDDSYYWPSGEFAYQSINPDGTWLNFEEGSTSQNIQNLM